MPSVNRPLLLFFYLAFLVLPLALPGASVAAAAELGADLGDTLRSLAQQQWQSQPPSQAHAQAEARAQPQSQAHPARRVEVQVGSIDPRLRLAPCTRIEPQWPGGTRPWGQIRVALRCVEGPTPWKVYVPVTIKVYGAASVATEALPAGTVLQAQHLRTQEADLAASNEAPLTDAAAASALGRTLARSLAPGQALRASDLRSQQWFAAGDVVRVVARGEGYQVDVEGTALEAGVDGKNSRVRTESGRILSGRAVAARRIELRL